MSNYERIYNLITEQETPSVKTGVKATVKRLARKVKVMGRRRGRQARDVAKGVAREVAEFEKNKGSIDPEGRLGDW